MLIGITTSTIAAIAAIGLTRRITKPLAALTIHTQRIAAGDLDQRVKVVSDDEIGLLAMAFNRMAGDLKEITTRLYRHEKLVDIGLLLAEINHRLRNPIAGINNYARLLQKKLSSESPGRKEVDRIREGTEQIDTLLRRLSEPSSLTMDIKPISLDEVIKTACGKIQVEAKNHGIRMIVQHDGHLPHIAGDRERLSEVFENLIDNAFDAVVERENGERLVKVCLKKESEWVAAVIEDTGCGISQENLSRVFDPLFSTKENGKGTGLGLYIAHTIIERHGGKIHVQSSLGKGTCFTVKLPASGER